MESLAAALVNDGQTTIANALLAHYREIGVTNDELLVYLQFKRLIDQGNQFPDAAVIAKSLGESTNAVFQRLHEMLAKKLLTIESITADDQKIHDRYKPEVIELALREAVLRQVYNLTYMDRILLNWQKRNLKTAAQVEAERQRSIEQRLNSAPQPQRQTGANAGPKIPLFKLGEDQS